jgi:hypothetical protein
VNQRGDNVWIDEDAGADDAAHDNHGRVKQSQAGGKTTRRARRVSERGGDRRASVIVIWHEIGRREFITGCTRGDSIRLPRSEPGRRNGPQRRGGIGAVRDFRRPSMAIGCDFCFLLTVSFLAPFLPCVIWRPASWQLWATRIPDQQRPILWVDSSSWDSA